MNSASGTATGNVRTACSWTPILYADAPEEGTNYRAVDALGSVVATNDPAGNVTHSVVFDAWGNERASTGTRNHPFSYTGREVGEAGLLYYRARYYDPTIGRFTQEDPVFDPAHDVYSYVANSPMLFIDPSGAISVPATPKGLPNAEIQRRCSGRAGGGVVFGCYNLFYKFSWDCKKSLHCNSWRASVTLKDPHIDIFFSNDCGKVPSQEIINEEMKHVEAIEKIWPQLEDDARMLRQREFPSYEACNWFAEQVSNSMKAKMGLLNADVDRTHPQWSKCN